MFKLVFTIDYELHGNGDGNPIELMVEPTRRLLEVCDKFGAKLTIMADVAEILKFHEYYEKTGIDKYGFETIMKQLRDAVFSGHDVQLHLHSGYMDAQIDQNKLHVNWIEYNLALLPYEKILSYISKSKEFLESEINKVLPNYFCYVFRAANWSMMPTKNISEALIKNNFIIDTSVYKYGFRNNKVKYDYKNAYDALIPWPIDGNDICQRDDSGRLFEIPIYSELRAFYHFITFMRIFRFVRSFFHRHKKPDLYKHFGYEEKDELELKSTTSVFFKLNSLNAFNKKMAWKLDFNQSTASQLIKALKRIVKKYRHHNIDLPIVFIGHSKSFLRNQESKMESLFRYIKKNDDKFDFSKFADIDIAEITDHFRE